MKKHTKKLEEQLKERLNRITELEETIEQAQTELLQLTGLSDSRENLSESLPDGLVLMNEIIKVMQDKGSKMGIKEVKKALDKKHKVNLLRRNIQGAMVYMWKKKGILEKVKDERGVFVLKSEINSEAV